MNKFFKYWIQPWHPNKYIEAEDRAWEMLKKSQGGHIWTGKDLIKAWVFGFILGCILFAPLAFADDNSISIEQIGSSNQVYVRITQEGFNNIINTQYDGSGMYIDFNQFGNGNEMNASIIGNNNQVIGQQLGGDTHTININGNYNLAGTWYGTSQDNDITINLLGDNNFGAIEARGSGGHTGTLNLENGARIQVFVDTLVPDTFTITQYCASPPCATSTITRE
jgi:hypothetical protein